MSLQSYFFLVFLDVYLELSVLLLSLRMSFLFPSPLSLVRLIRKIFPTTVPLRFLCPSSLIPFFTFVLLSL